MSERGVKFKEAIKAAIRAGMGTRPARVESPLPAYDMGEPLLDVTKALRLAGECEDKELSGRMARGA